jgi:ATP-dependent Clp protease ATP-binding subunit ClpA
MATQKYEEVATVAIRAIAIASENNHEMVTLEHVLSALLENNNVKKFFMALSVDIETITDTMNTFMKSGFIDTVTTKREPSKSVDFDVLFLRVIGTAPYTPKKDASAMDVLRILAQFPHEDCYAVSALLGAGVTALSIAKYMSHGIGQMQSRSAEFGDGMGGVDTEPTDANEAMNYLKKYSVDLNQMAKDGKIDPLIGRAEELDQIVQITARRTKNNCILVGDSGVGKTAVVEGLATKIVNADVPEILKNSVIYALDIGSLVAGTRFRGDFEERMKLVLKSLTFLPDSILFIDEIHTIMDAGSGSKGSLDVANLLKPALAKGQLRCIGSTTMEEYRKHIEKDRAIVRRFKKVIVNEPSPDDTKNILRGLKSSYETFHGVTFTDEAIDAAVDLTHKYVTTALLPDKAIDIIDNAGARQRILPEGLRKTIITEHEIEQEVSRVTKIPAKEISESEESVMLRIDSDLKSSVFGQAQAIETLVDSVFVSRAGLRDTNKPAGSYMFVGPTGVGKTEMTRQLAKTMNIPLIKFDMSEYMEKHSVSKFIGSPPGYVGYGEGGAGNGLLVNAIDANPSCVLLLDEIEKAHEDIFNMLLQVMDDAVLTSSGGKSVNFRNVILIMTSNAGIASFEKNPLGFAGMEISEVDEKAIKNLFRPEFRNRLDAIVKFNRLQPENMCRIVDKFISELEVLSAARNVTIHIQEEAREWLAKEGYDPAMGARPLARVINEHIKKPLARLMLLGPLKNGGIAVVEMRNGKLVVE